MAKRTVLAIGLDPAFADFSAMPGLTPELIGRYVEAQIEQLRLLGFEAESCLVDRGETAEATVSAALGAKSYDCVVIGAGLRQPPELLVLFEKVLNLVHRLAPTAAIAFNTRPADTAEAAMRWIEP